MFDQNRFGKYAVYAIGEIVLVVIGILIALQINNWNESRKEANFELQILKSLKESLEIDLRDIDENLETHRRGLTATDSILVLLKSSESIHPDSLSKLFADAIIFTRFVHSTSAFESLKAKGINIISNDALQQKIVDVYDSQYSFFLDAERDVIDEANLAFRNLFPTRFEEAWRYDVSLSRITGQLKPLDFNALKTDREFLYFFKTLRNRIAIYESFFYAKLRRNIVELLAMIDDEIAKLEGA